MRLATVRRLRAPEIRARTLSEGPLRISAELREDTKRKAERARELHRAGLKQTTIAADLGVSDARVSQLLNALNEPPRKRGPVPGERNKEVCEIVAAMWLRRLAGEISTEDVATAADRSVSTVTRIAKRLGLEVPLGRLPKYPRETRPCPCGCGTVVTPTPARARDGLGFYVNEEHYRRHQDAARAELEAQTEWLTVAQTAKELKLTYQAVLHYGEMGRLVLVQLDDVPELRHLGVLETKWLVRRTDMQSLKKELRAANRSGVGPPDHLRAVYSDDAQRRWDGKLAAFTAEEKGKRLGPKTGARAARTDPGDPVEEAILARAKAGQSQRQIANAMGPDVTRQVVRGVLRRHRLAA